jgi:cellulose biosynthesis protein BcsQ
MALIVCHSPKGGVGTTFIAAQIAMQLAQRGHEVAALDFTYQDALKLFFGVMPSQALPEMGAGSPDSTVVAGVDLMSAYKLGRDADFRSLLATPGEAPFAGDKIFIADVASDNLATKDMLLPHALMHVCTLMPQPGSLAALSKVQPGTPTMDLTKTLFVLNNLDDTVRLSRHSNVFMCELFGPMLLGTVRRDEAVNEAAAMFEPIARHTPTSVALTDLNKLVVKLEERYALRVDGAHDP